MRRLFGEGGRAKLAARAALGALACAGGLAAPGVTQAQVPPIRHVVVIYLENHSFDNLLGYWCDGHPGRCPDGGMPPSVRRITATAARPKSRTAVLRGHIGCCSRRFVEISLSLERVVEIARCRMRSAWKSFSRWTAMACRLRVYVSIRERSQAR